MYNNIVVYILAYCINMRVSDSIKISMGAEFCREVLGWFIDIIINCSYSPIHFPHAWITRNCYLKGGNSRATGPRRIWNGGRWLLSSIYRTSFKILLSSQLNFLPLAGINQCTSNQPLIKKECYKRATDLASVVQQAGLHFSSTGPDILMEIS